MALHSNVLINTGQAASNLLVSTGTGVAVTTMYFCNRNPASAAVAFNLYLVKAGFQANSNNLVYFNKTIASNDTYIVDWEKLVLDAGDTIRANANVGNAIVSVISTIGV